MSIEIDKIIQYITDREITVMYPYVFPMRLLAQKTEECDESVLDEVIKDTYDLIHKLCGALPFEEVYDREQLRLYNACVFYIKESLNTRPNTQYEFLLFPGSIKEPGVLDVFFDKNGDKGTHIFKIDVKRDMMSDKKNMIIFLCHELAHYVGSEIRCRESRLECIYSLCARILILGVQTSLLRLDESDIKGIYWDKIEEVLPEWISLYYRRNEKEEYIRHVETCNDRQSSEIAEFYSQNFRHMFFVRPKITGSIDEMLKCKWDKIFEPYIVDGKGNKSIDEKESLIQKCIQKVMEYSNPANKVFAFPTALKLIEYPLKESYADMISILELRLTPEEYLGAFTSFFNSVLPSDYSIKLWSRIAIVVTVMCYEQEGYELGYKWSKESFEGLLNGTSSVAELYRYVNDYMNECICNAYFDSDENLEKLYEDYELILNDKQVICGIARYLIACKATFHKEAVKEQLAKNRSIVQKIYNEENVDIFIDAFENLIKRNMNS